MARILWRYMTFEGFTSLVLRSALWFSRIDQFTDKTEGLYPAKYYDLNFLENQFKKVEPDHEWKQGFGPRWQAEQALSRHKLETRHRIRWAVNCWHSNRTEAEAFWKSYANWGKGIAIQSTLDRLKKCFRDDRHSVKVDEVRYVDRDRFFSDFYPPAKPFFLKPRSYFYEREVRAYIDLLEGVERPPIIEFRVDPDLPSDEIDIPENSELARIADIKGAHVKVDLGTLILRVFIGPNCEPWIEKLVRDLLSRCSVDCHCVRSSLYDYPKFR